MSRKHRVLFVCMGNICRSPAGEGVFRAHLEQDGRTDEFEIDSAGTIGYHAGSRADPRMRAAASRRGYDLTSIARRVEPTDLDEFDLIVAMDRENERDLRSLRGQHAGTIELLSRFLPPGWPVDVPDPYYGGEQGFEDVLDMVETACVGIVDWFDRRSRTAAGEGAS